MPQLRGRAAPSARRRPVTCGFCGATVALDVKLVRAADYRAALARFQAAEVAERPVRVGGHAYRILGRVGRGESSDVLAAERVSPIPERVLLKILRVEDDAERLQHEDQVLRALRASKAPGAPHFSRVLPRPVAVGRAAGTERWVAVQGHRPGFTADLAALRAPSPAGWTRATGCGSGAACSSCSPSCTTRAGATTRCCPSTCSCTPGITA